MSKIDMNVPVMLYNIYSDNFESMLNRFMRDFNLDKNGALVLIDAAKRLVLENESRRKFVQSYMHYTGENYGKLDGKQMWKVYCQADGYGYQRASELRNINGGWDSSHVRDSTIDGWKRMEAKLNEFGFKREN